MPTRLMSWAVYRSFKDTFIGFQRYRYDPVRYVGQDVE